MKKVLTDAELKYELAKYGYKVDNLTKVNRPVWEEALNRKQRQEREKMSNASNKTWAGSTYDSSRLHDNNFDTVINKYYAKNGGVGADYRRGGGENKSWFQPFFTRIKINGQIISYFAIAILFLLSISYTIYVHWNLFLKTMTILLDAAWETFDFVCRYLMLPLLVIVLVYFIWYKFWSPSQTNLRSVDKYHRINNIGSASGLSRFDAPSNKSAYRYDDFNNPDKRWWQFTDQTSRFILIGLFLFLLFLTVGYLGVVHRDKLLTVSLIIYDACYDTVDFIYKNMILPLFVVILIAGFVYGMITYKKSQWRKEDEEKRQIYEMVEKIMAKVKRHHEDCLAKGNTQPYLAIPHVRDMLIPPNKRKEFYPIWEKAVEYINETDSRVRTETQCISGEEFMVWRWLQMVNPGKADEKVWQGHAFPEEDIPYNMPRYAYFECLKVRGLFDAELETEDGWPEHIQDAILEKLGHEIRVLHMAVDMESKDGCVYMKMATKDEAGQAYKILHGSWFNGRLVSVKYLRPERYHERFPDATRASVPLCIKKPRHSTAFLR